MDKNRRHSCILPPLKGVNLGGWLLMEGYILHSRNIAEHKFKKSFKKVNESQALLEFERLFRENFIQKEDFKRIASFGAKIIRLPFNARLIEEKPFSYNTKNFIYLDRAFQWAKDCSLKIILDLHAACGAQNCDWHSDSAGAALLWEKDSYRQRTYKLWEVIAERYRQDPSLYAYDILNEPVLGNKNIGILKEFYKNCIRHIRCIDKRTIIYLEGALWAQEINFLEPLLDDNIGVSIHAYQPLNFVFNFSPFQKYPGKIDGALWNKKRLFEHLKPYHEFALKNKVRMFAGEFGINWRGGYYGETAWLNDMLDIFDDFGFDYTYWTYKAIANNVFPDGIYQYIPNNKFIQREGPLYGWETYIPLWKKNKNDIVKFWDTKNYTLNKPLNQILKKHFA